MPFSRRLKTTHFWTFFSISSLFLASAYSSDRERTYNVMISPVLVPFGGFDGSFNLSVSDRITLGLGGTGIARGTTTGGGVHLRLNYYLSGLRLTSGWYVSPRADFYFLSSTLNTSSGPSLIGLAGYHWVFDSGLNLMLGAGGGYGSTFVNSPTNSLSTASGYATFEGNIGFAW